MMSKIRQVALLPKGDAGAVAARVVPALLVHRLDVPRQVALGLVGDAGAVGARVLAQLQVHSAPS